MLKVSEGNNNGLAKSISLEIKCHPVELVFNEDVSSLIRANVLNAKRNIAV